MWQQMEERQVVRGATWQSLKERFLRSIRGRLDSFDLTAEARQQLLKGGHASATSSSPSNTSTTVSSSPTLFSASSTASSSTGPGPGTAAATAGWGWVRARLLQGSTNDAATDAATSVQ